MNDHIEKCKTCGELLDDRFARYRLINDIVMCVSCFLKTIEAKSDKVVNGLKKSFSI
jgi:hypothetical protein